MTKIVTVEEMRAIETAADKAGVSYAQMMDNAGRAVATRVKQILAEFPEPRVAVLVGPGNNGGDGLVAGRLIAEETKATVTFFLVQPRPEDDDNFAKVKAANLLVADAPTDSEQGYRVLRTMIANADVIVDALLGTGSRLPIKGEVEKVLRQVHQGLTAREADRPRPALITPERPTAGTGRRPVIVAVDMPTGLNADTGELDPNALYADETITFEAAKPGHVTFSGKDAVGILHVAPLSLPEKLKPRDNIKRTLVDAPMVRALLPDRPASANKGTFGKALVIAGSLNYIGAPALAAQAAYRVGAGLVTVATVQPVIQIIAGSIAEATWVHLPEEDGVINESAAEIARKELATYTAALIGPGLGREEVTKAFLDALLVREKKAIHAQRHLGFAPPVAQPAAKSEDGEARELPPLVIDADALNLLSTMDEWWTRLPARTILTPHPGEMARLAKTEAQDGKSAVQVVQSDRFKIAADCAKKWNCVVVLKGAHTVVADPDGRIAVIPFASAALARAGTGDVLAGAMVGYLAQGLDPFNAAVVAAYVHGYAGELAADYAGTKASVVAGDVIAALSDSLNAIESAE